MRPTSVWLCATALSLGMLLGTFAATTEAIVINFDTEDDMVTPLLNGQIVDPAFDGADLEFGTLFNLSTTQGSGGHLGATIFDSTFGVNPTAGADNDLDLQVGLGNILILQDADANHAATQVGANGLEYVQPDDEAAQDSGSIVFDFLMPISPVSVVIVDADNNFQMDVILTDSSNNTRTYTIFENWSNQFPTPLGYETLDLTSLVGQDGEGLGGDGIAGNADDFTSVVDAGLNQHDVVRMEFKFVGDNSVSGGIDTLTFRTIPEPTSFVLMALAVLGLLVRRRV